MIYRIILIHFFLYLVTIPFITQGQTNDDKLLNHSIHAYFSAEPIIVNGKLDEKAWQKAEPVRQFKQVEPLQGNDPNYTTEVRIVITDKLLVIGAFARDKNCKSNLRVPNLSRDFNFDDNDLFGVAIDAFNSKRNAVAFQVTPYGTQRDLQSFDDAVFDVDWDALWYAKTLITDSGWYAEIAIPFQSIRYNPKIMEWGINFIRIHRSSNEISAWPGYPRSFDTYRMTYAGSLAGINPPVQRINLRLNPYVLTQFNEIQKANVTENEKRLKYGGEIKWAISQNTVLDATINTDFAQADVDRQVINLSRFSVYFPERRQFFLENSGLFITGDNENIEPFFSRRIGLDETGKPLPLLFGSRLTSRNEKRSIGAIFALQDNLDSSDKTSFSVIRYALNHGRTNNTGILFTHKKTNNETNTVAAISGVHRFGENWRIRYLWTQSFDKTYAKVKFGYGANLNIDYTSNTLFFTSNHSYVSEKYIPGIGFTSRQDLIIHNSGIIPVFRPSWKPGFVRSLQPGIFLNVAQKASDLKPQEGSLNIYPLYFILNNGGKLDFRYQYAWQLLGEDFQLVNTMISRGSYFFHRYKLRYNSDQSRQVSGSIHAEAGGYFNGTLTAISAEFRLSPSPYVSFTGNYELNKIKHLGAKKNSFDTHLLTTTVRLALNPNVQFSGFYQYNSTTNTNRFNLRLSWQYRPLSFIYLVLNRSNDTSVRDIEQQGVVKINFLKQFS